MPLAFMLGLPAALGAGLAMAVATDTVAVSDLKFIQRGQRSAPIIVKPPQLFAGWIWPRLARPFLAGGNGNGNGNVGSGNGNGNSGNQNGNGNNGSGHGNGNATDGNGNVQTGPGQSGRPK